MGESGWRQMQGCLVVSKCLSGCCFPVWCLCHLFFGGCGFLLAFYGGVEVGPGDVVPYSFSVLGWVGFSCGFPVLILCLSYFLVFVVGWVFGVPVNQLTIY